MIRYVYKAGHMRSLWHAEAQWNLVQTMPNLSVTEGQIPAVPLNAEFTYLGRCFSFDLKNESAKQLGGKVAEPIGNYQQIENMNSNKAQNLFAVHSLSNVLRTKIIRIPVDLG